MPASDTAVASATPQMLRHYGNGVLPSNGSVSLSSNPSMPLPSSYISSALKKTFSVPVMRASAQLDMIGLHNKRSSLKNIEFDESVRHTPSQIVNDARVITLNSIVNGIPIQTNSSEKNFSEKKNDQDDELPTAKITFFQISSLQVGHSHGQRVPGSGMMNVGNTCYLNSTLQALFHTPALYNYLLKTASKHINACRSYRSLNNVNNTLQPCMICAVTLTLKETLNSPMIKPNKVYEKLKSICKHMVHGRQEDAHEFLRYLIDALQRSFLVSAEAPKTLEASSKETTPFNQIFGGYLRQEVTCLKCKYVSVTHQHFMDILLDIRTATNITDALNIFFKAERLGGTPGNNGFSYSGDSGGGNTYKCEKCKVKVPAKKKCFIERPPVVLCVQLKRFSLLGGKISKPVQLTRKVDMLPYMKKKSLERSQPPLCYKLVSMITHVGPSPNCGHYTAIGEAGEGTFYQFDDSSVRQISTGQALNTASYVVFYEMLPSVFKNWCLEKEGDLSTKHGLKSSSFQKQQPCIIKESAEVRNEVGNSSSNYADSTSNKNHNMSEFVTKRSNQSEVNMKVSVGLEVVKQLRVEDKNNVPGVKGNFNQGKSGLVPYDSDGDSDSSEDSKFPLSQYGKNVPQKSILMPRILAVKKQEPQISSNISHSEPRPCSPASAIASSKVFYAAKNLSKARENLMNSASGTFKITESQEHNPSVGSADSAESTCSSGKWKITSIPFSSKTDMKSTIKSSSREINGERYEKVAFEPDTPGKNGNKRPGSLDGYEEELDKGKMKKVRRADSFSTNRLKFNSVKGNPFQQQQSKSYSFNGSNRNNFYFWKSYNSQRTHANKQQQDRDFDYDVLKMGNSRKSKNSTGFHELNWNRH